MNSNAPKGWFAVTGFALFGGWLFLLRIAEDLEFVARPVESTLIFVSGVAVLFVVAYRCRRIETSRAIQVTLLFLFMAICGELFLSLIGNLPSWKNTPIIGKESYVRSVLKHLLFAYWYGGGSLLIYLLLKSAEDSHHRLAKSEQWFRAIFDSEPECVKLLKRDGTLQDMNAAGLALVEVDSLDDVLGQCIYPVVAPEHRAAFVDANEAVFSGESAVLQFEIIGFRGTRRWMESHNVPLRNSAGDITAALSVSRDITARKQAEADREKRLRHLHALDRVHHVIGAASTAQEMLENVVQEMLDVTGCDRAWLCYPCDPAAATVQLPVSCSRAEFPGIVESNAEFPVDEQSRSVMQALLDHDEPLGFHGEAVGNAIAPELASQFQIRALMVLGLKPRTGAAWSLGLHQCSYERVWSDDDIRLVKDIGRRIEDALTSLLSLRDLRISEDRFRTLFEHAPEAILVHDVDQDRFVEWNQNALDLFKISEENLAKLKPVDVSASEQPHAIPVGDFARQQTERALAGEDPAFEWLFCDSEGRDIPCEVRLTRLPSAQRRLVRGSITDITRRKELEEESRQHQKLLAHTNRVATVGEMATGFAHELNQPLAAISMFADTCLTKLKSDPYDTDSVLSILKSLSEQSLRAGSIVDRIRKFVGKEEFMQTACRVDNLFDDVLSLLNSELMEREITVDVQLPDSLGEVYADRVQIEQVLVNLVHNSADAISECETAQRRLELGARDRDDGFVEVTVRDFGPGMTDEVAAKVFDAFFSTKSKGMGMGLAICRTIVESHGGRIEMVPAPREGVACTFTLPIHKSQPHVQQ